MLLRCCMCLLLGLIVACAPYPRDPEGTTERVERGVLRVGVIHDPPFVDLRAAGRAVAGTSVPDGSEARMVQALAHDLQAQVVWSAGGAEGLFEDLEHLRLDLVIGGVSPDSPWQRRVALSLPYLARNRHGQLVERVSALPPGENRWQMRVESFQRTPVAQAILRAGSPSTTSPQDAR